MNKEKKPKSPLLLVFLTVFVDLLGFGILIPVIPQLLANPFSKYYLLPNGFTINQGYILLGFLTAIFPFMQFIATPILGQLSDKYGRKPILAVSLAGTCVSYILFAIGIITKNIPLLFVSRGLDGITGGNISVAQAAIADTSTPENRAKAFGIIGAAFGLGFILGPYLGGKLSDNTIVSWFDATTPFWFAAILSGLNALSVFFLFPETNKFIDKIKKIDWTKSVHNIGKAIAAEKLRVIFLTSFILTAGFTFFTTFASVFFINRFGWKEGNIGDFFAYIGLWAAITQIIIVRPVSNKYREDQILKFSLIGMAIGLASYFLTNAGWQMLIVAPIFSVFNGLTMASSLGLISRSVDSKIQGEVLGISTSVQALGQTIPAALSGFIAAKLSPNAPLVVAVIAMFISWLVFVIFYKYSPENIVTESAEPALAH
jgi:MFS transporter, DHA1 family, tetracycline resistance protein